MLCLSSKAVILDNRHFRVKIRLVLAFLETFDLTQAISTVTLIWASTLHSRNDFSTEAYMNASLCILCITQRIEFSNEAQTRHGRSKSITTEITQMDCSASPIDTPCDDSLLNRTIGGPFGNIVSWIIL